MTRPVLTIAVVLLVCAACGGGTGDSNAEDPGALPLLAAGSKTLVPVDDAPWAAGLDLDRLGVQSVEGYYDLTTPVEEPLAFDVLARGVGNAGTVRVSVAHVQDAGSEPVGGAESLSSAGLVASGPGRERRDPWLDAVGDGFSRITIRGRIDREQVLAVQAGGTALVRLQIGAESEINAAGVGTDAYPGVIDETTLYSSDAWAFGLPTIAVSGDRTSIVCYEGDRADPNAWGRYEMRLQHEAATGDVKGGGSEETTPDSGNWRDHEIAALYNVLAVAHAGGDDVTLRLSFDRGATFEQIEHFLQGENAWRPRLVQIGIALDYTLAIVYWRSNSDGTTDLVLVEGRPTPYPPGTSPTSFAFDPPVVVHHETGDVTPALMSVAYSDGGDLVIGYAFTRFTSLPDRRWETLTQNRCAVRLYGEVMRDSLVEEDLLVGRDPSVALLGSGAGLDIFFAYEVADGVRLRVSDDAGLTFSAPTGTTEPAAHMPTVFARAGDANPTVDLLYLAFGEAGGMEIHLLHWPAFEAGANPDFHRLTIAKVEGEIPAPPVGGPGVLAPPEPGLRITQVAWLGYDAVLDGDEIVVVYDEATWYALYYFDAPMSFGEQGGPLGAGDEGFVPVDPPPLAEGMTEDVPAPEPLDMHQLRLLRLR